MSRPLMSKTQNICLILLSFLFLLLAIIMINQVLSNRETLEGEYKEIDIESEKVSNNFNIWQFNFCEGMDSLLEKMYSKDFQTDQMSKEEKIFIVLKENDQEDYTLDEINKKLNKIIDSNITSDELQKIINEKLLDDLYDLSFDGNVLKVVKKKYTCNSVEKIVNTKIIKAEENDQHLKIYISFAYGIYTINDEGLKVIDYYKEIDSKKFVERVSKEDKGKVTIERYDTYLFTFDYNDDNYLLESIVKND